MNDIIKMAREAGLIPPPLDWPQKYAEALERFAALVRADEREQCAKVCEGGHFLHDEAADARFGKACAATIRSRT